MKLHTLMTFAGGRRGSDADEKGLEFAPCNVAANPARAAGGR
ncbi:MAG: hypothetical protein R6V19_15000 [Armatimonadota bacterium]